MKRYMQKAYTDSNCAGGRQQTASDQREKASLMQKILVVALITPSMVKLQKMVLHLEKGMSSQTCTVSP